MEITSLYFLLLLFASIFPYYLIKQKYRVLYISIISSVFIASFSYYMLIYVVVYSFINYYIGNKIPFTRFKKMLFWTGIIFNLMQLIILKYSSFVIDPVLHIFNSSIYVSKLSEIIIPIGISFFTLQSIGYLINVKMGWEKPESNFFNFFLYISFFPKFLSGPIERSNHFLPQIREIRVFDEARVSEGLKLMLFGFFKKVAIANQLAHYALSVYNTDQAGGYISWVLFLIQPLYLYFDFSGYTDIARGASKLFGIDLLPNFQRPFFSENVTTFWRRFHMSLSSWFNDYIFKQTSFKYRKWGIYASTYAVFLTWFLFGIWHGAGWNFMLIGLLQALAINYEFFTKKKRLILFSKIPARITIWFGRILTFLFYCVSLVFFFCPDIKSGLQFLSKLGSLSGPTPFADISIKPFQVIIYIPIILLLELLMNDYPAMYTKLEGYCFSPKNGSRLIRWSFYSLLITIIYISGLKSQQFIYANF